MALDANPGTPRTDIKSRQYRTFTYQDVDRVPDVEFGYWPQTIRRWLSEGMDLEMTHEETNNAFNWKVDQFLGFDDDEYCHGIGLNTGMDPVFEHEILERREGSVIQRDAGGVVAECFDGTTEESSIPHYISFPVEKPEDWAEMKFRYDPSSPSRIVSQETIDLARTKAAEGCYNTIFFCGPYAFLRGLMGFMNVSTAFYEFPDMIHDMLDTWTALCVGQIEQLGDTPIDHVNWWEDMASKNGPFVSPDMFREFIQPSYRAIMVRMAGGVRDGTPHSRCGRKGPPRAGRKRDRRGNGTPQTAPRSGRVRPALGPPGPPGHQLRQLPLLPRRETQAHRKIARPEMLLTLSHRRE